MERTAAAGSALMVPAGCTDPKSQYAGELADDCWKQLLELKETLVGGNAKVVLWTGVVDAVSSRACQ